MTGAAFDTLAEQYDLLWSETGVGRHQRKAIWRQIDTLFRPGDKILDLGCGTGVDALHLMERAIQVLGIDASGGMVRVAKRRGVNARQLPIESIGELDGIYDGALSNFGALNCIENLETVAGQLSRRIRRNGYLVICIMGRFCFWETFHFLRRGQWQKAGRRWSAPSAPSSLGLSIRYPSVAQLKKTFRPYFRLQSWSGVGVFVPPSYVQCPRPVIEELARIDSWVARWPLLRMLSDHRCLVFVRI